MLIVHLFVSYIHVNLCHSFSSFWCRGLAVASACGSSWTFLFTFIHAYEGYHTRIRWLSNRTFHKLIYYYSEHESGTRLSFSCLHTTSTVIRTISTENEKNLHKLQKNA